MKQTLLLLSLLLALVLPLAAQSPQQFKFQAVARDAADNPYTSTNLAVRVSIVRNGASGLIDYSERHVVTTSPLGVFDLAIGGGVQLSGSMANVNWGNHPYYLKIDIDPDGGTNYLNLGASQLLSVPYAIYASQSGSGGGGTPQTLTFDPATNMLTISGGNAVTLPAGGVGPAGPQGPAGTPGSTGPQGPAGVAGPAGPMGLTGPAGTPGANGAPGPAGPTGPTGATGSQGPAGQDGTGITVRGTVATVANLPAAGNTQGDLFIVSADGNGYVWNGTMWTNVGPIRGPQGAQGPAGVAGPVGATGSTGPAGAPGATGPQGPAGVAGPTGAPGPAGPTGPQGPAGQDGTGISIRGTVATVANLPAAGNTQGDLFIVSADGNGYVWDGTMWTNVGQIQGPQGPQGIPGPAGTPGAVGPAGPQGPQGSQGPQGNPGPMGATGAIGPVGSAGAQGNQGPQGNPGPTGATGAVGPAGPIGPVGSQGVQGIPGPVGAAGAMGLPGPQGIPGPVGPAGTYTAGTGITISGDELSANNNEPIWHAGTILGRLISSNTLENGMVLTYDANFNDWYPTLPTSGGASLWSESGSDIFYDAGSVAVGSNAFEADNSLSVSGGMFVNSSAGSLHLGYPGDDNKWALSTTGGGADLLFRSRPIGGDFTTRMQFHQNGELSVGDISTPSAWAHIRKNSTVAKPSLLLQEDEADFARLAFGSTANTSQWHIAGRGENGSTGAASSRLNFYFGNDQGGADRMTILGNGHVGIGNTNPDEDLVIGSNLGSGWAIPVATVGGAVGGAIEVGTPTISFATDASTTFGRTRLMASDANGFGQGLIEMRTRQLNIGTDPAVNSIRTYPLRVVQNNPTTGGEWGFNLINGDDAAANWEFFVTTTASLGGNMALYFGSNLRGTFNAASGNYSPTSDARLKTNIRQMAAVLPGILRLEPKQYNYKTHPNDLFNGFLAQDLQAVFPELVTEAPAREGESQSTLLVDYSQMTVIAVKAIQEQQATIDAQAQKIANLEARLARLEALLKD